MSHEHQQSRRVGPAVSTGKTLYMPPLIYVLGVAIEWAIVRLAQGGLYW